MATDRLGTGISIYIENTAGGGVFTELADVHRVTHSQATRAEVDVTDAQDTTVQSLPGLVDHGTLTFVIAYDMGDTAQEALKTEVQTGVVGNGKDIAVYHAAPGPDQHIIYAGFFTGFQVSEIATGEHVRATVTFKINSIVSGPTSGAPATS